MSRPIIEVRGLSKRYRLGAIGATTLRDEFRRCMDRWRGRDAATHQDFWALREVSFDIQRGEVVGVIGRNGAGKSTLLKILSRITEPTAGHAILRGRVASLLEVGTGFHPELTGRENIFLNGAILGMTRAEIRRKFDEIVAFAEVAQFIDTPVKRYSSGMYVRLAFAVAAHLEPEILIVDEVLAVGDAAFQQKCLGKIETIAGQQGRTVFLVSHNILSIQQLCHRVLLLQNGSLLGDGEPLAQIQHYVRSYSTQLDRVRDLSECTRAYDPRGGVRLLKAELDAPAADAPWKLPFGAPLRLRFEIDVREPLASFEIGLGLFNLQGQEIVSTLSSWQGNLGPVAAGNHVAHVDYGAFDLAPGIYRFGVGVKSDRGLEDYVPAACEVEIVSSAASNRPGLTSIRGAIARQARYSLTRV